MELRPLNYITPSMVSALNTCFLQVAFRADPAIKVFQPPAARLGTACHALLERIAKGELASQPVEDWSASLEIIWQEEIAKQEEALLASRWEAHFGLAVTWPRYSLQKARVFLKAEKLLSYQKTHMAQATGGHHQFGVERYYQAFQERARGRVDVVYESEQGIELIDYKTGRIFDEDETGNQTIKESYKNQLHFYAAMHHDVYGSWPVKAHLVPLTGQPISIEIDPAQAGKLVQAAMDQMVQFNKLVSEQGSLTQLASPALESCRYCNYKADCPAFWRYPFEVEASDWGIYAHLEAIILDVREMHRGEFVVILEVVAGTIPTGNYMLNTNRLADLSPGRQMRLINAQVREQPDGLRLRATDNTIFVL